MDPNGRPFFSSSLSLLLPFPFFLSFFFVDLEARARLLAHLSSLFFLDENPSGSLLLFPGFEAKKGENEGRDGFVEVLKLNLGGEGERSSFGFFSYNSGRDGTMRFFGEAVV